MIDKVVRSMAEAMAGIGDGAVVLIGGFGAVGQPDALIEGLIEQGATGLTVVANNAGTGHAGLARLMELGRARRIVCSFPRSSGSAVFEELYKAGKLELEIVPQGTLAERLRAAGAGGRPSTPAPPPPPRSPLARRRVTSAADSTCWSTR